MAKKALHHPLVSINEAKQVLEIYLRTPREESGWKAKKQPGGGYSGNSAILEDINGNVAVVSRFENIYFMVLIMADGFITTAFLQSSQTLRY